MNIRSIRRLVIFFSLLSVFIAELAFISPQMAIISIKGQVVFDTKTYPGQKAKINITEDGKTYKTLFANEKGEFNTSVEFNHLYMIYMSMDYHGTSKVLLDTKVPEKISVKDAGAFIEFKCQLFELFEGLNTGILNKPILILSYNEEKNNFEFDKKYTEALSIDLDGFVDRSNELKQRRKEVLKNEEEAKKAIAASEPVIEKERKVIEFESEKKKPVAENKSGHKNIMDLLNNEGDVSKKEEKEEVVIAEIENEKSDKEEKQAVATSEAKSQLFLEEELDESEYNALNIIPKRILIDGEELVSGPEQKKASSELKRMEMLKLQIRQVQEISRMREESKIKEIAISYNLMVFNQKEERLKNKKIQTDRLSNLMKTIAIAEIYYKKAYYKEHPITHNELFPSIVTYTIESIWKDTEKIMIRYPNESRIYRKDIFSFGLIRYYRNEEKIEEAQFCSEISQFSKSNYSCIN